MSLWRDLIPHLHWGAIISFLLAAVAMGFAILDFRRARVAPYYILRELARRRGLRWLVVLVTSFLVGVGLLYLRGHPPAPAITTSPPPSVPPTATISPATSTPTAVSIPLLTPLASPTPTRRPTATPPFIPTATPAYPLPETALSPLPSVVPAGPEAQITLVTFALGEEDGLPVDPGFEFAPGDRRIYLFFEYRGMDVGVVWTYGWYREGEYVEGNTCPWGRVVEDCPRIFGRSGSNYLFFRMPGGYEPGVYEVRVWIENRFQDEAQFVIR